MHRRNDTFHHFMCLRWRSLVKRWAVRGPVLAWWLSIAALVVVRLWLTAADEIVPVRDDSLNYAERSLRYFDLTSTQGLPQQSPGVAIFAAAGRALGVPYKLWLDGWFIVAAWYVATMIRQLTRSRGGGVVMFAALLLNPWFMNHTLILMSEPPTSLLLLVLAAGTAPFFLRPIGRWTGTAAWVAGGVSAGYVITRPELPVVIAYWCTVWCLVGLRHRCRVRAIIGRRGSWRLAWLALPLVMTVATVWGVQRWHQARYGVPALSVTESSGLRGLIDALYSIPPEEPIRYAPVTYQSLTAACDACPTLDLRRAKLLDRNGPNYQVAQRRLALSGEFGTWLNWLLVEAFAGVDAESERAMWQAVDEIRSAQREGRLGWRRARFPIDPLWREWLGDVVPVFASAIDRAVEPNFNYLSAPSYLAGRGVEGPIESGFFDEALLRRQGTIPESVARIQGILEQPISSYDTVHVLLDGKVIASSTIESVSDSRCRFLLTIPASALARPLESCWLEWWVAGEKTERSQPIALQPSMERETLRVHFAGHGAAVGSLAPEVWTISASEPSLDVASRHALRRGVIKRWPIVQGSLLATMLLLGAFQPRSRRKIGAIGWLLLAVTALFAGRLAFVTLIEVWMKWGLHRYAETCHLLSVLLLALLAFWMSAVLRRGVRHYFAGSRRGPRSLQLNGDTRQPS